MNHISPPYWMLRLLRSICPNHLIDEIEGDFQENYNYSIKKKNILYAKRKALGFLILSTPRLLINRKQQNSNAIDMIKSYLTIAIRNIKRRVAYSIINITGLAVGLACCMLIGIYVLHELSYDRFHENYENIYRINSTFSSADNSIHTFMTPTALLPRLKREFSEVGDGVRMLNSSNFNAPVVKKGSVSYQEDRFAFTDSLIFEIFSYELLQGSRNNCLKKPNSLVISETMADKYFKGESPMGEVLKVNGTDYQVTAVMRDMPNNSHIDFDFLASFTSLSASKQEIWGSANYASYFELNEGANPTLIENEINELVKEELGERLGETSLSFDIMPITDIHLRSDIPNEIQPQNDISYIRIIIVIGVLILVIACINYMNLATARSTERSKEVGMRKVLGAVKNQVFYQFMGESIIMVFLSLILALIFVNATLPVFNQIAGKELMISDIFQPNMVLGILIVFILVSFFAGTYPALRLSSFLPSRVLKGKVLKSRSGVFTRQTLVIIQFSISIFLIIGTLVIYKQLNYIRDKKLGYSKENVMLLSLNRDVKENYQTVKGELEKRSDVLGFSAASESPVNIGGGYSIKIQGLSENNVKVNGLAISKDFVETMDMQLTSGRNFINTDVKLVNEEQEERQYNFIVNEALVKQMLTNAEDIIGTSATMNGRSGEIVGVVKDFHFTSLHRKINPLVMFLEPSQYNKLFVRVNSPDMQATILGVEEIWKKFAPDSPFIFQFLDDEYDDLYRNEQRLSKVFTAFATLAIIIACLGLFGLVSFTVEQRNKEIGVRKVLGASIISLLILITKDFSKLVLIAFLITAPVAYYLMNDWLTDFEYRVDIGALPLIVSVLLAGIVALITVSFQAIKAASVNPVETLRNE